MSCTCEEFIKMNLGYTDINPKEVGKFIRELLSSFFNNEEPLYNLHYMNNNINRTNITYFNKGKYQYPLVSTLPLSELGTYTTNISSPYFLFMDADNLYFNKEIFKKQSTSDFRNDSFALSTVLSLETLTILELSSHFSDIDLGSCGLILRVDNIIYFYYSIVKGTIK